MEQSDIHSPQATVEEALWFSARLRLTRDTSNKVMWAFIYEVCSGVLSQWTVLLPEILHFNECHAMSAAHATQPLHVVWAFLTRGERIVRLWSDHSLYKLHQAFRLSCPQNGSPLQSGCPVSSGHGASGAHSSQTCPGGPARSERAQCGTAQAPDHCSRACGQPLCGLHGRANLW